MLVGVFYFCSRLRLCSFHSACLLAGSVRGRHSKVKEEEGGGGGGGGRKGPGAGGGGIFPFFPLRKRGFLSSKK